MFGTCLVDSTLKMKNILLMEFAVHIVHATAVLLKMKIACFMLFLNKILFYTPKAKDIHMLLKQGPKFRTSGFSFKLTSPFCVTGLGCPVCFLLVWKLLVMLTKHQTYKDSDPGKCLYIYITIHSNFFILKLVLERLWLKGETVWMLKVIFHWILDHFVYLPLISSARITNIVCW